MAEGATTKLETGGALWCEPGAVEIRGDGSDGFEAIVVELKPRG